MTVFRDKTFVNLKPYTYIIVHIISKIKRLFITDEFIKNVKNI